VDNGYAIQLSITYNLVENEGRCLQGMLEKGVDGILAEPTRSGLPNPNLALYQDIRRQGIPIVFLNAHYPSLPLPYVCMDDRAAGKMAAACLIQAGHTNIAGLFKVDDFQGHLRYLGYMDALGEAGLDVRMANVLWFTTEDMPFFPEDFSRVLRALEGCTGLVCYNDYVALTVVEELLKRGVDVPGAVSVVGIDDADLAAVCKVPLTTIANPAVEVGAAAAKNLLRSIADPTFDATATLRPQLVQRESVAPLYHSLFAVERLHGVCVHP
jgi:GntR family transcriptional regulator of arabinose operon